MLYRIRKNGVGVQLFSTGGEKPQWKTNGKIWSSLSSFASHLALQTSFTQKMDRCPISLFSVYGDCIVVEIPEAGIGQTNEVPFKEWYEKYYNSSEKFRAARKAEKAISALSKVPAPKPNTGHLRAEPVTVKKPTGWDVPTKTTVTRALQLASKFVPNLGFVNMKEHPKNGETYAHITISGENYALLKL